ncbi:hypothetical protein MASR1M32_28640 [Rhodobacter sp.]
MAFAHMGRLLAGVAALAVLAACGEREVILPGERFSIRTPLEDSVPTEANPKPKAPSEGVVSTSRPISLPAAQANADWGQRGGNARHAAPHAAVSKAPVAIWSANMGAGNSRKNRISAAPVVLGGRVFAMDAGMSVTALSTGGGLLWQTDLTADFDKGGGVSGGGLAASGAQVFATTAYGEVVALDAKSGGVMWRQRIDAPPSAPPRWKATGSMSRAATDRPGRWMRPMARWSGRSSARRGNPAGWVLPHRPWATAWSISRRTRAI